MRNDPLLNLVMSIYYNPGVYALLLGSGVSRSAQVPTGWEITLDLIQKIAKLKGEDVDSDPETWYRNKFKEGPDYSKLLKSLAPTQSERNALLRSYFEPNQDELENGIKVPTKAHFAIASLVKSGYISVILTTNFDRLIEQAIEKEGIIPDVISSDDSLKGAVPLIHSKCTVVKLHGDYKDTRIKNTPIELAKYSSKTNSFLDRILDEFGLIVCGWSGQWDTALRGAILRCPSRRFTTYWAVKGQLNDETEDLVKKRRAVIIKVESADKFFSILYEKIISLQQAEKPHPISMKIAVESVKRYLTQDKFRIDLHDLIHTEVEKLYSELASERFDANVTNLNQEFFQQRLEQYEVSSSKLIAMMTALAYYGNENEKYPLLLTFALERLCKQPRENGKVVLLDLQFYPALLLLYSSGIVSIVARHYKYLAAGLIKGNYNDIRGKHKILSKLNVWSVFSHESYRFVPREDALQEYTPANNYILDVLREQLQPYVPDNDKYTEALDIFEYLLGLTYMDIIEDDGGPVGCFRWRYGRFKDRINPFDEFFKEGIQRGVNWKLLRDGFFSGSVDRIKNVRTKYDDYLKRFNWY